jgi:Flp pilus assembly protein TadD
LARTSASGRNEETEAHVLEALRISPRDASGWMLMVGFAKLGAGRDEAVVWLNRSIGLNPNHPTPHCLLAAALAHLGRMKEAREAARAGLELNPAFNRGVPVLNVQRQSRLSSPARARV